MTNIKTKSNLDIIHVFSAFSVMTKRYNLALMLALL